MLTKRKFLKVLRVIRKTRLNADLFPFLSNLMKHKRGRFRKDAQKDIPFPSTLMLELTNRCNLHCITCPREYGFGKEMQIGDMPTELAVKIIDETIPYLKSIGLTGMGETLFAKNLVEVACYIKKKKPNVVIAISTNANIPAFIEKIKPALPYIDTVQVSTDGVGKGYEDIRKGASFEYLEENLRQLVPLAKENHVDVMFNMVITKRNYEQMPHVIAFADEVGVRFVNFTYFNLASVTDIPLEYYQFFSSETFLNLLADTRQAVTRHPRIEVTGLDFPGNPGIQKCPLLWDHFQINHDGQMPPCCAKPFSKEYSYGNVRETSVRKVVNSEKAKQLRAACVAGETPDFCRKCHFVHL